MRKSKTQQPPSTVITLTLPTPSGGGIPKGQDTATILIQRGELAHVRQFHYVLLDDLITAVREATQALSQIEEHPPVIPELPAKDTATAQAVEKPPVDQEPTIDVPLKKGTKAVKLSHLKIIGGETDAAAYRQAVLIAGKLIDGKLWDDTVPIRIDDVYALAKKMGHLTVKDLSLFTLEDFVQVGDVEQAASRSEGEAEPLPLLTGTSTGDGIMFNDDANDTAAQ